MTRSLASFRAAARFQLAAATLGVALVLLRVRRSGERCSRLGTDYGGWWVPERFLGRPGLALCVGAGEDISFDLALVEEGYKVVTLDPTPRSVAYVEGLGEHPAGFSFLPLGLWNRSGTIEFYLPRDPAHVSLSATNLQRTNQVVEMPVASYEEVLEQIGAAEVDLVKLDIEGAEVVVLPSIVGSVRRPGALLVEFDSFRRKPVEGVRALRTVAGAGYVLARREGLNISFVR